MINIRGIKARPHDIEAMMALSPALVELHCSADDLKWTPSGHFGVPLAVHVPEYADGELLDPASLDEDKRLRAQELYSQAAGRAAAWARFFSGRPRVVFHPGGQTCDEKSTDKAQDLFEALGKTVTAMKTAAGADVDVLIENLPAICWFNGGSWRAQHMTSGGEIKTFCRAHKIGATLDLCHLHLTPHNVGPEIAWMRDVVKHVHYSDGRFKNGGKEVYEEGLQINDGDMPLPDYFSHLVGLPDDIYAVPEIWYGHENGGAAFVEAWKRIQTRILATAGAV